MKNVSHSQSIRIAAAQCALPSDTGEEILFAVVGECAQNRNNTIATIKSANAPVMIQLHT